MALGDKQVLNPKVAAGHSDYLIPGAVSLQLKAVSALFTDNTAGVDWLPAVVAISDANHVLWCAADQAVKVTAGADAEVSWFPGVKHAPPGVSTVLLNQSRLFQRRGAVQTITSGVVTALVFDSFTSAPGYTPGLFGNPVTVQNPVSFGTFGTGIFTLTVNWPAAAYDRYIELTIASPDIPQSSISPRVRQSVTPDGDRLVVTAAIAGGPTAPTTVTANVFQASGIDRNATAELEAIDVHGHLFLF